jgi:hypothetical protein
MGQRRTYLQQDLDPPGPYDRPPETADLWFLPEAETDDVADLDSRPPLPVAERHAMLDAGAWRAAEAVLAADLAALSFDLGRLAERVRGAGPGAAQRLALAEAASLSWWAGDRIAADRLALWLSYRIGAAEEDGGGLIRTAWAARRLAAPGQGGGLAERLAASLGEKGRGDGALLAEVAAALAEAGPLSPVAQGCALCHLWRSLDERPDHLRSVEAAVLGARVAMGQGAGLPFLPLTLTGFSALTATGGPEARLAGWIGGAQRAVLSALMTLDRLADWRAKAEAETADLQGRTPGRLIAALAAHPMLGAAQAEAETGASRAAVQRNLDTLAARGLVREVTGQGRFRVWAARV